MTPPLNHGMLLENLFLGKTVIISWPIYRPQFSFFVSEKAAGRQSKSKNMGIICYLQEESEGKLKNVIILLCVLFI